MNCFCSNSILSAKHVPSRQCNIQCVGDPSAKCGGNERMSVFILEDLFRYQKQGFFTTSKATTEVLATGSTLNHIRKHVKVLWAENVGPCLTRPCKNEGRCELDPEQGENLFHCVCSFGFEGDLCEQVTPLCRLVKCQHGSCVEKFDDFFCRCDEGYAGYFCEKATKTVKTDGILETEEKRDAMQKMKLILAISSLAFGLILITVLIHCCRVYRTRSKLQRRYERQRKRSLQPKSPPPGTLAVSNKLCADFFCCCINSEDDIYRDDFRGNDEYGIKAQREKSIRPKQVDSQRRQRDKLREENSEKMSHQEKLDKVAKAVEKIRSRTNHGSVRKNKTTEYGAWTYIIQNLNNTQTGRPYLHGNFSSKTTTSKSKKSQSQPKASYSSPVRDSTWQRLVSKVSVNKDKNENSPKASEQVRDEYKSKFLNVYNKSLKREDRPPSVTTDSSQSELMSNSSSSSSSPSRQPNRLLPSISRETNRSKPELSQSSTSSSKRANDEVREILKRAEDFRD